jgi:MFS family permease
MRIAVNGVWGNLGVAGAALITGYFIDHGGWRVAFIVPGMFSAVVGVLYAAHQWTPILQRHREAPAKVIAGGSLAPDYKALLMRISAIVFITTAVSSLIFQSTTFALPKVFDERLQGIAQDVTRWLSATGLPAQGDIATAIGAFTFVVFAIASMAQLVVGGLLDRYGPRSVFLAAATIQIVFFALMPGLSGGWALATALGFMLGAFGQIPITDFMIGKLASGPARARTYAVRYVVAFTVLAASLPLIAFVHAAYGFDMLFRVMAVAASVIFVATACLPTRLPAPALA